MKTESIADFLARGGKITKVPANQPEQKPDSIKHGSNGGVAVLMTMDQADLFYGEKKESKAKKPKKAISTIDIHALPEELRKKYIDEVIDAAEGREEEDEG